MASRKKKIIVTISQIFIGSLPVIVFYTGLRNNDITLVALGLFYSLISLRFELRDYERRKKK